MTCNDNKGSAANTCDLSAEWDERPFAAAYAEWQREIKSGQLQNNPFSRPVEASDHHWQCNLCHMCGNKITTKANDHKRCIIT